MLLILSTVQDVFAHYITEIPIKYIEVSYIYVGHSFSEKSKKYDGRQRGG